ncbi:MAG: papain-like cysteine protease family protein [Pirellulaceae bacterium]
MGSGELIGIPSDLMTYCAAKQEKQNWCWAACIQMVYSTQGINVSQDDIVKATLGVVIDVPAGPQHFMDALKGWKPSQSGRKSLEASFYEGPPQLSTLTLSLKSKVPVILGLTYPDQNVGHGVVITAVYLEPGIAGKELTGVIVRDPAAVFSATKGKRRLEPAEFKNADWHIIVDSL